MNLRKARAQAARGKSASPNFLEVGCANFPVCFPYQTKESRLSKNAVARRASFAEGVEGGEKPPLSRSAERETPQNPKGAPHRVNWKTVRWTVFQEGHALQGRAAPSPSPVDKTLQGRKPLNEQRKKPTQNLHIPSNLQNQKKRS